MFVIIPFLSFAFTLFLVHKWTQQHIGRKIHGEKYDFILLLVQIAPMIVGVVLYGRDLETFGVTSRNGLLSLSLGFFTGLSFMFVEYFLLDVKLLISDEMLSILPRVKLRQVIRRVVNSLVFFPISEEVLYRGSLQSVLSSHLNFFSIVITTLLFMSQHFMDPLARTHYASRKNQIFLLYESLAIGAILYLSGSLLGCILAHVMMNLFYAYYFTLIRE